MLQHTQNSVERGVWSIWYRPGLRMFISAQFININWIVLDWNVFVFIHSWFQGSDIPWVVTLSALSLSL